MTFNRIGLIGDIHAQASRLDSAIKYLQKADVGRILCTGDVPNGPQQSPHDTERCFRLLQENDILTIRGNHDRWLLAGHNTTLPDATDISTISEESLDYLRNWPTTLTFESPIGPVLFCHGMGNNDMQGVKPDDDSYALQWKNELNEIIGEGKYKVVIAGHTHYIMVREFFGPKDKLVVINPGTLLPAFGSAFAIVNFGDRHVEMFGWEHETIVTTSSQKF